ncbi:unnamed protein product [Dovyalis caffra]|uniref:RNase H type-1 domain-containing protein n=1 Tax=Dovyalis caffra TaxID=77055 RepID=A0AAV1R7D2_9ROSI|nr:unnamed protein product [Dovyalis caffra]
MQRHEVEIRYPTALKDCNWAQRGWFLSPLSLITTCMSYDSFFSWIKSMHKRLDKELIEQFCTIGWDLWNSRNDLLFNDKATTSSPEIAEALAARYGMQLVLDMGYDNVVLELDRLRLWFGL